MNKVFWVTSGDGVLEPVSENEFTNESFVRELESDDSAMSKLMCSSYPSITTVRIGGNIPKHWSKWEKTPLKTNRIEGIVKELSIKEIRSEDRLYVSRNDASRRTREIMKHSRMQVTPRGIESLGVPPTIDDTFASLVNLCYFVIEKNTIANMKSKSSKVSQDRIRRIAIIVDALGIRSNVLETALISAYTEPSVTMMSRAYFLSALYGISTVNAMVNDLYYKTYHTQVDSIMALWESLK